MLPEADAKYFLKKSYEIAYALFRITPNIQGSLSLKIQNAAISLLEAGIAAKPEDAFFHLKALDYFVQFGSDMDLIGSGNAEVIIREINELNTTLIQFKESHKIQEVDVAEFFSAMEPIESGNTISMNVDHEESPVNSIKAEMRQSTILEKIRQNQNCRLRDLQESLPDCSERTIRYDLQSLLEKNLIQRVGNGGPSVYYQTR